MYVCMCFAVSDRELQAEIDDGARDEEEIGERCGAGTGCGTCLNRICDMLRAADPSHGVVEPALSA